MSRSHARAHFSDSPETEAKIKVLHDEINLETNSQIRLHELSVKGLRFSSSNAFSVGDNIIMNLRLFAPTNHIFGEVIWKEQTNKKDDYTYGIKIIMSDYDYYQFMNSYDTYIKNKQQSAQ
ncbi:hypothetical protein [Paraliobacillus sediminis]|uniref:hypothetical protein n=1 Tax=Paraliobacillus sediminis TaxID=1885916 RepID=UPI000E3C307D|nr:hypothetical protein [Paraliobacillus sediminis]